MIATHVQDLRGDQTSYPAQGLRGNHKPSRSVESVDLPLPCAASRVPSTRVPIESGFSSRVRVQLEKRFEKVGFQNPLKIRT